MKANNSMNKCSSKRKERMGVVLDTLAEKKNFLLYTTTALRLPTTDHKQKLKMARLVITAVSYIYPHLYKKQQIGRAHV